MVRSPPGQTPERLFCVQCQTTANKAPTSAAISNSITHPASTTSVSSEGFSRVSTPPTEVSDALSSPTFAPPPNVEELGRRRAQSDMASAEIGKRMLRGWAMLAEECPNDTCYGVPLIRPPKVGGGKDPRKECVVCGHVYIYERDVHGLDILVPLEATGSTSTSIPSRNAPPPIDPTAPSGLITADPGAAHHTTFNHHNVTNRDVQPLAIPSTLTTLHESSKSLEHSLQVLAAQLNLLSRQVPVDYVTVGDIAHSMEQVTNALTTIKALHFQEKNKYVVTQHLPQM